MSFARVTTRSTTAGFQLYSVAFSRPTAFYRKLSGQTTSSNGEVVKSASNRTTLSALSNLSLLRSLLITTISSKPFLLRPSLSVLSWLASSPGNSIWNVDRNPILRFILKNTFYKQFCAGETVAETKETIQRMKSYGFRGAIITYAREIVFDQNTNQAHGQGIGTDKDDANKSRYITAWRAGAFETIDMLGERDHLAFKITGAGPEVTDALGAKQLPPKAMMDALHDICARCRDRNIGILIDAESQQYQEAIFHTGMELSQVYNRDGQAIVYNTYQAYLKSTPQTVASHLAIAAEQDFTLGLKLVRGAYIDSDKRSLIHDTKQDTDDAYDSVSQGALKREIGDFGRPGGKPFPSLDLFLASHNKASLLAAHETHQQRVKMGLPTVKLGMAQLQGMADDLSFKLIWMGNQGPNAPDMYKCSTWGTLSECLGYLMRRAAENRDSVSRTGDEHKALKQELSRRLGFS